MTSRCKSDFSGMVFFFFCLISQRNLVFVSLFNIKDFNAKPDYNMSRESLLTEEVKLHNLIFNYISFRAYSHHHPLLNTKILDKELLEENMSCFKIYSTHVL